MPYFDEQFKSERYERIRPSTLPNKKYETFRPNNVANSIETSTLKFENLEGVSEPSPKEVTNDADNVESEGEKSPPLAGANVMNVILVAAECAPWSKTGNSTFYFYERLS